MLILCMRNNVHVGVSWCEISVRPCKHKDWIKIYVCVDIFFPLFADVVSLSRWKSSCADIPWGDQSIKSTFTAVFAFILIPGKLTLKIKRLILYKKTFAKHVQSICTPFTAVRNEKLKDTYNQRQVSYIGSPITVCGSTLNSS